MGRAPRLTYVLDMPDVTDAVYRPRCVGGAVGTVQVMQVGRWVRERFLLARESRSTCPIAASNASIKRGVSQTFTEGDPSCPCFRTSRSSETRASL